MGERAETDQEQDRRDQDRATRVVLGSGLIRPEPGQDAITNTAAQRTTHGPIIPPGRQLRKAWYASHGIAPRRRG